MKKNRCFKIMHIAIGVCGWFVMFSLMILLTANAGIAGELRAAYCGDDALSRLSADSLHVMIDSKYRELLSKTGPFWSAVQKEKQKKWEKTLRRGLTNDKMALIARYKELYDFVDMLPNVRWAYIVLPEYYGFCGFQTDNDGHVLLCVSKWFAANHKRIYSYIYCDSGREYDDYDKMMFGGYDLKDLKPDLDWHCIKSGYIRNKSYYMGDGKEGIGSIGFTYKKDEFGDENNYELVCVASDVGYENKYDCNGLCAIPFKELYISSGEALSVSWCEDIVVKMTDVENIERRYIYGDVFILDGRDIKAFDRIYEYKDYYENGDKSFIESASKYLIKIINGEVSYE